MDSLLATNQYVHTGANERKIFNPSRITAHSSGLATNAAAFPVKQRTYGSKGSTTRIINEQTRGSLENAQ